MEPICELPPVRIRLAPLFGSLFAAVVSGSIHTAFVVLLGIVAVPRQPQLSILQIHSPPAVFFEEFEELIVEQVNLETLEVERPESQTHETMAGNETNVIDIGGAPDAMLAADEGNEPTTGNLLNPDFRRSLVNGLGGPGSGSGRGGAATSSFQSMVEDAREYGLDIVIAMDTTGSMGGEIETVKKRIVSIGGALLKKVPDARISIVSYKDHGDDYVVKGVSLTSDLDEIQNFLAKIKAGGGGDPPEAVEEGLKWAIFNNEFRPSARKVVLLFGDRPPHEEDLPLCLSLATQFRNEQNGVVSTITCRQRYPIPHFGEISRAGGGEAFTLKDSRRIMEELLVLLFGSRHRKDVVEFFELDSLDERPSAATEEAMRGLGLLSDDGAESPIPKKPARGRR